MRRLVLARVITRATRSRALARVLLGCDLPLIERGGHYFDVTTLGLISQLRRCTRPGMRVLDIGTGSVAAIALWLWRRRGCGVTCTEIDARIARCARQSVQSNGAPIEVVEGRFFEGAPGDFDLVVFNPPYVPTAVGERRGLPASHRSQWDGGRDGTEVLAEFLAAFADRDSRATALVGVNRRHVPRERVDELLANSPGVRLAGVRGSRWLPVDVYFFESRKSPSASTSSPLE